jgi:hypothetical protein
VEDPLATQMNHHLLLKLFIGLCCKVKMEFELQIKFTSQVARYLNLPLINIGHLVDNL